MTKRFWILFVSLAAMLALAGCGGSDGRSVIIGGGVAPTLRVLVTDAPFSFSNVKSATVEIQRIDLHRAGGGQDAFLTLDTYSPGKVINLVALQNGLVETLFEGNPPPGDYDAVRIVVVPKQIVLVDDDGTDIPFKVPSGPQTGIKVFVSPAISVVTNLSTDLVLDFDLSRSFVVQGNPSTSAGIKGFHFRPVVRAINRSIAGSLTFVVDSDNGTEDIADDAPVVDAHWTLTDAENNIVADGISGADGTVSAAAIPAGTYTLTVSAPGQDVYTTSVTINEANLTDLGTVRLRETGAISGFVTTSLKPVVGDPLEFPVEDATVEAGGLSAQTDPNGAYQIPGLLPGPYTVSIEKDGYSPFSGTGTSSTDSSAESSFQLTPLTAEVSGVVANGSEPVAGATVTASVFYGERYVAIAQTTTDSDGSYTLTLPTASYQIAVGGSTSLADVVGGAENLTVDFTVP